VVLHKKWCFVARAVCNVTLALNFVGLVENPLCLGRIQSKYHIKILSGVIFLLWNSVVRVERCCRFNIFPLCTETFIRSVFGVLNVTNKFPEGVVGLMIRLKPLLFVMNVVVESRVSLSTLALARKLLDDFIVFRLFEFY